MSECFYAIDYKFPKKLLLNEFNLSLKANLSKELKISGFWYVEASANVKLIAKEFLDFYCIPYEKTHVSFFLIEKNTNVPWHADADGSVCAINCMLSEKYTQLNFETESIYYDTALINVKKMHSLTPFEYDRIIFRITFRDPTATFGNVLKWLK